MLRGSCKDIRHPFISLFEMQQDTWPFIFQEISTIVSNSSLDLQALNQIKPFVIYGLCYGSIESRSSLWNMLQGKLYHEDSRPIVCWILESFFWQQQVCNLFNHSYYYLTIHLSCAGVVGSVADQFSSDMHSTAL